MASVGAVPATSAVEEPAVGTRVIVPFPAAAVYVIVIVPLEELMPTLVTLSVALGAVQPALNAVFNWHDVCLGSVTDRMCTRPAEPKRDHPVQAQKKEDILGFFAGRSRFTGPASGGYGQDVTQAVSLCTGRCGPDVSNRYCGPRGGDARGSHRGLRGWPR